MKIRMTVNGKAAVGTLEDNSAARDFVSLLPLDLSLKDYAAAETISDLPRKLSSSDAPPGDTPAAGDIFYYSPWGNLALFYKDAAYAKGLVRLGKMESGMERLLHAEPLNMTIELMAP